MPAVAAQFLKSYAPFAWTFLQRRSVAAIVLFRRRALLIKIHIQNDLAVEHHVHPRSFARDLILVPISRLEHLRARNHGAVKGAGELRRLGGVRRIGAEVARIDHLQFKAIERRITPHRKAQPAAAVSSLTELPLILQNEIAVLALAHEPRPARLTAVEDAIRDSPHDPRRRGLAHVVPGADFPAWRHAIAGEQRSEPSFIGGAGASRHCRGQNRHENHLHGMSLKFRSINASSNSTLRAKYKFNTSTVSNAKPSPMIVWMDEL